MKGLRLDCLGSNRNDPAIVPGFRFLERPILAVCGGYSVAGAEGVEAMRQWEYFAADADMQIKKVKLRSGELVTLNDYLKMMGAKGWELVAVAPVIREHTEYERYNWHVLYFKREAEEGK